ncbi:MAG: GNAT family N-acetyltransferase [Lachnospiraceae bacterium]|nr:GNAT family N-acetyltransferase [Lachnospiraceae bacterium]MBQ9609402.1 GNAT family N-acetyltransferase [Lachnospiraceae bacterium]
MEIVRINNKIEYKRIKSLYLEAFPKVERAPFLLLKRRAKKNKADVLNFVDNGEWLGFAYVISDEYLAYLFYFAIDSRFRGKGYGSEAIRRIMDYYKEKKLFLALEDWRDASDNPDQRNRRHMFYKKNGLKVLPYRLKEAGMIYAMMGACERIEPNEYKAMINGWLGWPLKLMDDMKIIIE